MLLVETMTCASALCNVMGFLSGSLIEQYATNQNKNIVIFTPEIMEELADVALFHKNFISKMTGEELKKYQFIKSKREELLKLKNLMD